MRTMTPILSGLAVLVFLPLTLGGAAVQTTPATPARDAGRSSERSVPPEELSGSLFSKESSSLTGARDMYSRHFARPDGTVQAVISTTPVHYLDADGRWVPIDPDLVEDSREGKPEFRNERNALRSRFSAGRIQLSTDRTEGIEVLPRGIGRLKNGRMTIAPNSAPLIVPHRLPDRRSVEYEGLWGHGSRSRFQVAAGRVKESIILDDPPLLDADAAPEFFQFDFEIANRGDYSCWVSGKSVETEEVITRGTIEFRTSSGERAMSIEPPVAWEGAELDPDSVIPLEHAVRKTDSGWALSVRVPAAWLLDPARSFPVTIDPTATRLRHRSMSTTSPD